MVRIYPSYQNWKDSKAVYHIFRLIYKMEPTTCSEIIRLLGAKTGNTSEQISALKREGLILSEKSGRKKWLSINRKTLLEKIPTFEFNDEIVLAPQSFSDWIHKKRKEEN